MTIEKRIADLGTSLPIVGEPKGNYIPTKLSGHLLYVSGQLCFGENEKMAEKHVGKVGSKITPEVGFEAARLCLLHVLAHAKAALGSLDAIRSCVRLGGFVNAEPDYIHLGAVMNGASETIVQILGEAGRHSRTTIGVATLPLGSCVEVEAILEVAR
ncbi:MAG: RidA family protein [Microvirga sp.]|jgi:enamine deaminase RidA (YjgF/YER057c/UK114 family)|nr:RidA family protein [Microvirga sp.]